MSRQYRAIRIQIDAAIQRVLERGWFILGQEGEEFEAEFAAYLEVDQAVGVASGTDAIQLALMAAGIKPGDEVITAANTCVPTVIGIVGSGAVPVLVDADPITFNLDPMKLEAAITSRTRAIIPVHMYGQAADLDQILEIASSQGVKVIEDAAHGVGATYRGKKLGTLGDAGCFSFYPSKNLGAYGDGGAVVTNDPELATRLRQMRNYGQASRERHASRGINSRLDEMQAAILRVKLPLVDDWNSRRRSIAERYSNAIANVQIIAPEERGYGTHNYHLYVIRCDHRGELRRYLAGRGVSTLIHYPVPIHLLEAFNDLNKKEGDYPTSERHARTVLSLPIFPELSDAEVDHVASCINEFFHRG